MSGKPIQSFSFPFYHTLVINTFQTPYFSSILLLCVLQNALQILVSSNILDKSANKILRYITA